ncbi:MAG: hypothetical protein IJT32_07025, partial [Lachnospiraceae bacterium]|nr:hypothetical protein [Lachnospiraceae bacterium]
RGDNGAVEILQGTEKPKGDAGLLRLCIKGVLYSGNHYPIGRSWISAKNHIAKAEKQEPEVC